VPRVLRLDEALLALAPDAALWARAFLAWNEQEAEAQGAPGWLQEGLRQLLSTELPALRAWLKGAEPSEREDLVEAVASTCVPELVEAWVDACWESADEELRRVLSGAISILLDRSRVKSSGRQMEQLLRGAQGEKDALRILLKMEGALEQAQALMKLPPEGLRTWRRFASRVLPYRGEFLEQAVRQASSDTEAWEAASRYLEAHSGDTAYLEVLTTMEALGRGELAKRVLAQWLERRAGNVRGLAEAVVVAERMNTPCEHLHPVLDAFLRALEAQPPAENPPEVVRRAQAVAREHDYRLRKRRAPRKKKASADGAPRPKRKSRAKPAQPKDGEGGGGS
jgi:acyl-CoA synthetase (AMP-forming)/AMP-acid ligase II